jgi:apolipoprotein D and lipocalin family protein
MNTLRRAAMFLAAASIALSGCAPVKPMPHVADVDLSRYMGRWYVIASIPSFPERHAYNAVESYVMRPDGRIATTFEYRNGGFDALVKTMHPIGSVHPGTGNAVWGVQFIWPIQAEYVIAYLGSDYRSVIVGRSKRDYVWIMARTPTLPPQDYAQLVDKVAALGYDTNKLRRVPQQWPASTP